jgi:uncharacterized protein YggE
MKSNTYYKTVVNYKVPLLAVIVVLAVIIGCWQPWQSSSKAGERTVTVTGEAKITAEPDEYVFTPNYEFKDTSTAAALKAATDKNTDITVKLIALGVAQSKVKADTGGYAAVSDSGADTNQTYYDNLTVTVGNKILAQKVQDYLVTTSPAGSVTPQANFSDALRKKLGTKGRSQAIHDARAKAEQNAQDLGFKLGKVKTVSDDSTTPNRFQPLAIDGKAGSVSSNSGEISIHTTEGGTAVPIQVGEESLSYSISVTYYVH